MHTRKPNSAPVALFGNVNGTMERLFTAREAARALRVSRNWFYQLIGAGQIIGIHIDDGCQLFALSELEAYAMKRGKRIKRKHSGI